MGTRVVPQLLVTAGAVGLQTGHRGITVPRTRVVAGAVALGIKVDGVAVLPTKAVVHGQQALHQATAALAVGVLEVPALQEVVGVPPAEAGPDLAVLGQVVGRYKSTLSIIGV
jgi:hypothetical protein